MTEAVTGDKSGPSLPVLEWARILFRRLTSRGFRLKTLLALNDYLEHCLDRRVLPQVNDVLRSLLPKSAQRDLIPCSLDPVPF